MAKNIVSDDTPVHCRAAAATAKVQAAWRPATYFQPKWFTDEATSGAIKAKDRKGLSELLSYARSGDTVVVYAIDRLGQ